jgi:hypothetical protein
VHVRARVRACVRVCVRMRVRVHVRVHNFCGCSLALAFFLVLQVRFSVWFGIFWFTFRVLVWVLVHVMCFFWGTVRVLGGLMCGRWVSRGVYSKHVGQHAYGVPAGVLALFGLAL